jgi:hypothetical protein
MPAFGNTALERVPRRIRIAESLIAQRPLWS